MPVKRYGLVNGRVERTYAERKDSKSPHYQIKVLAGGDGAFRVPVNVQSNDGSMVRYHVTERFEHPIIEKLAALTPGYTDVKSEAGGLALDFVRGGLFDPNELVSLPANEEGDDNDLQDLLAHLVDPVMHSEKGVAFAWGERWSGGSPRPIDKRFGTSDGVHDIHTNQGNPAGKWAETNGVWQDGGLVLHDPDRKTWKAIFMAFESQTFNTDASGNAKADKDVTFDREDSGVVIATALVAPVGGRPETVSILNGTNSAIDLAGWWIVDKEDRRGAIKGKVAPGELLTLELAGPVSLSNRSGTITLATPDGTVVDAVSYAKRDVKPGRLVVF